MKNMAMLTLSIALLFASHLPANAASASATMAPDTAVMAPRNGAHDFDWLGGKWYMTFKRLRAPLTHSHDWYSFDGTGEVRLLWNGGGNFESGRLNSPLGRIDYATLRTYDTTKHQWSIYWVTAKGGLGLPPEVGSFDANGTGRFYCWNDTYKGRSIASRYVWTPVGAPSHYHFEQAFSVDHGKTWEVNWISDVYRKPA
ncbi:MAG TPA: hypothetical protein VGF18_10315 [Candidatus Tumulicola sp.]|jgi:hypothetical protein